MKKIKGTVERVEDEEKYAAIFMNGERYSSPSWTESLPEQGDEIEITYKDVKKGKNAFNDLVSWQPKEAAKQQTRMNVMKVPKGWIQRNAEAKRQEAVAADGFPADFRTQHIELMRESIWDAQEVFLRLPEGSDWLRLGFDLNRIAVALFDKRASHFFHMKNDNNGE